MLNESDFRIKIKHGQHSYYCSSKDVSQDDICYTLQRNYIGLFWITLSKHSYLKDAKDSMKNYIKKMNNKGNETKTEIMYFNDTKLELLIKEERDKENEIIN